jgi:hypothetical protein
MRLMIAALAALWMITPASASPITDDRYFDSRAPVAQQKVKIHKTVHRKVRVAKHRYVRKVVSRRLILPHDRITLTTADEQPKTRRETVHYASQEAPTPITFSGPRPRAWCGWFLGKLLGLHDRSLWLARNWAHVGAAAGKHVGAIVVWRHHVGKITAVRADGAIKVLSGNDGRAVRDRWRSARGVIAYRAL